MNQRALRWHGPGDIRLDLVPVPARPRPGHALVEVAYAGICGTDLHEYTHGPTMIRPGPHPLTGREPPLTLGHEISGTVTAVAAEADHAMVGRPVAVDPCYRCGTCRWCLRGSYHICERGGSVGLAGDGGFAACVEVPVVQLHSVPSEVSLAHAALAEPLAVGLHAATRGDVGPGDAVLVLGAGPIGVAALLGALARGAGSIYVSEPAAPRAELARQLGATEVFDPASADVRREVFLRTGREGPDVVIDATGRPEAIDLGIRSVRRGGRVVTAGVDSTEVAVDLRQLVLYERSLAGSLGYNFDIPRVLSLMASGRLDPSPLISAIRPLDEAVATFQELAADRGSVLKVLLAPKEA